MVKSIEKNSNRLSNYQHTSNSALPRPTKTPIAMIGLGCRFPGGANDLVDLWWLLWDGVDAITEVPANRWHVDAFYDPSPSKPGKSVSRWGLS